MSKSADDGSFDTATHAALDAAMLEILGPLDQALDAFVVMAVGLGLKPEQAVSFGVHGLFHLAAARAVDLRQKIGGEPDRTLWLNAANSAFDHVTKSQLAVTISYAIADAPPR